MQRLNRKINQLVSVCVLRSLLVGVLLTLSWGCASLPQSFPQPTARVPMSTQEAVVQFVQQHGGYYADEELIAFVRQRGALLVQQSQRPDLTWAFAVLDRSAAEVHAFPGGQIFLTRGAVTALQDWRELDRVLNAVITEAAAAPTAVHRQYTLGQLFAVSSAFPAVSWKNDETAVFTAELDGLKQMQPGYDLYASARRQEKNGDLTGAIRTYLQAATLAPEQPQILTGLGLAYLQVGDLPSARTHLNRAIRLQPDYYLSRMGRGYVFLQREDFPAAIVQLEKSVALLPIVRNRFLLADSYARNGQEDQALVLFRQVAADDRRGKLGRAAAEQIRQLEKLK